MARAPTAKETGTRSGTNALGRYAGKPVCPTDGAVSARVWIGRHKDRENPIRLFSAVSWGCPFPVLKPIRVFGPERGGSRGVGRFGFRFFYLTSAGVLRSVSAWCRFPHSNLSRIPSLRNLGVDEGSFAIREGHLLPLPCTKIVDSGNAPQIIDFKIEKYWGGWRDLNPRHPEPQSGATTN